jgi:hypothetical protein
MNRKVLFSFIFLILILSVSKAETPDIPLIKTTWKQRDAYALFSPNQERLGCWSVALAQILFHHGLVPSGQTSYKGKNYNVSANFDNQKIDFKNIVNRIDPLTSEINKTETARYLWYAALITGKDFGTGNYIGNSDVRRERLEKHFKVKTKRIRYPESSRKEIEGFIKSELKNGNPLLLFIEGEEAGDEGFGHALVIDGYKVESGKILVHLNFGWEGISDGWYELWNPIKSKYGNYNKTDRWIMAIRPYK